ncbi:unnamed protein product [Urochloa decumbens]|uniref:Uncharacterized protein n=1 Tax=Urochloa decumbens TaxID=240449 RepID=A0ABC9EHX2_9POAL
MAGTCAHVEFLRAQPAWALALAAVGLLVALRAAIGLALWVYAAFLRPGKPLRRRYGAWAVVTGATDGIGRAIAFRLAAAGLGLVLVGRNPEKLAAVAAEIKAKHPKVPEVRTFVLDFAGEGLAAGVEALKDAIRGLDVGVLVNNAGVSYPYARYFHEVDEELMRNLIRVNVEGVTRVTHAVLPGMVERKRGAIVNMGSGAASVVPSDPLYSVYAATKAYIDQFSRCLYVEYKSKGIDVQCQVPLYVATKMASIRKSSFMVPSSDTYARAAVRHIGYEPRCTPYWPHSVMWFLISILPESLIDSMRLGMCIKIRKKGLAKDAKKKSL